jgi:NADH dehydrogenase FAD-containing subunit
MEKCPDVDKKRELLAMMSEDKRKQLLQALERKKTKAVKNEPVKAIEHKRTKYENIKISNFV